MSEMDLQYRFMTDLTLGRLTKWLRLMGYDVHYHPEAADNSFLNEARILSRIALTRKNISRRQYTGIYIVIKSDEVNDQISELLNRLCLKPDPAVFFSRCINCNERLKDIGRSEAEGKVPIYIYENIREFRSCAKCERIYWHGSHTGNALGMLRKHIPSDRL